MSWHSEDYLIGYEQGIEDERRRHLRIYLQYFLAGLGFGLVGIGLITELWLLSRL